MSKLLIFTAPSGAGKTTITRHLLGKFDFLAFSVSATTRAPREHEQEGVHYYFLSPEQFKELIKEKAFVEWEEVYENQFYGTLKKEVTRLWKANKHILFDVDVKGAKKIKKVYGDQALAVFINPPSKEILIERLEKRKTEDEKSLKKRIKKATKELKYVNKFDTILVNDVLDTALKEAEEIVLAFINKEEEIKHKPV
ncbi:MAG: guanylate kinase [Saprospiraceae bacterium]|jgi:guanylate kinase